MREIAIHIHDSRSVAKEAVFRSHQALVRRCSPQVAQRSHTRVFHRLVVNLVEPRFSGIDKLGDWRRSLRVWDTLCLHDVLNSVLVLNECDDAHLCFTLAFDPSSARLRPRRELCRTLAEVRPRVDLTFLVHIFRDMICEAYGRAYGSAFMDQEFQPGTHFIELPDNSHDGSDDALKYKKAAAKAYVTMEFINILSGEAFDHDRHGAQLRIERISESESRVGLFDNGAIHVEVRKADASLAEPHLEGRDSSDAFDAILSGGGQVTVPRPTTAETDGRVTGQSSDHLQGRHVDPVRQPTGARGRYGFVAAIQDSGSHFKESARAQTRASVVRVSEDAASSAMRQ